MMYCQYYQAQIEEKNCWFFVAILRSFEHLAFDRTFDKTTSTFEFLVPQNNEEIFLQAINYFVNTGIVTNLKKLPNRLLDLSAQI